MIQIIYGGKGSGKTKKLIGDANSYATDAKGNVVYITDNATHSRDISTAIRFVDITHYGVKCACAFGGFVRGMIAGNHDIERIFVDRIASILRISLDDLTNVVVELDEIGLQHQVDFVITVSTEELPEGLQKYVQK